MTSTKPEPSINPSSQAYHKVAIVTGSIEYLVKHVKPVDGHCPWHVVTLIDKVDGQVHGDHRVQKTGIAQGKRIVQQTRPVLWGEDL